MPNSIRFVGNFLLKIKQSLLPMISISLQLAVFVVREVQRALTSLMLPCEDARTLLYEQFCHISCFLFAAIRQFLSCRFRIHLASFFEVRQ